MGHRPRRPRAGPHRAATHRRLQPGHVVRHSPALRPGSSSPATRTSSTCNSSSTTPSARPTRTSTTTSSTGNRWTRCSDARRGGRGGASGPRAAPVDQVLLTGNAALPAWVMDRVGERLPAFRLGVRVQRVSVALSRAAGGGAGRVRGGHAGADRHPHRGTPGPPGSRASASGRPRRCGTGWSRRPREYRESQLRQAERRRDRRSARNWTRSASVAKTNPDALAFLWWDGDAEGARRAEGPRRPGRAARRLPRRGGLDVTQVITPEEVMAAIAR